MKEGATKEVHELLVLIYALRDRRALWGGLSNRTKALVLTYLGDYVVLDSLRNPPPPLHVEWRFDGLDDTFVYNNLRFNNVNRQRKIFF